MATSARGVVWANTFNGFDEVPFGGYKEYGFGREGRTPRAGAYIDSKDRSGTVGLPADGQEDVQALSSAGAFTRSESGRPTRPKVKNVAQGGLARTSRRGASGGQRCRSGQA